MFSTRKNALNTKRRSPTLMENQQEIATPDIKNTNIRKVRSQTLTFGTTKWLTYTAVFAALAVVMKFIGQYLTLTPSFKITLIYVTWLIGGAVLGPFGGAAVCITSDILGSVIIPMGAVNPFLVLGNTLYGVIAGLVFKYTPVKSYIVKFLASGTACTLICTCILNTLAIYYFYGYDKTMNVWQYFVAYRAMQPVVAIINIGVTIAIIPLLLRLKLLPTFKKQDCKGDYVMPNISVKMLEGRSQAQKEKLARDLVDVLSRDLGADKRWITCTIEDYDAQEWQEIFKTEIADKPDEVVFKKPEYDPKILL